MSELFFMHNGIFFASGSAVLKPANRSFRYGDGLFETMKIARGNILNKRFHFERLFKGLALLEFEIPGQLNAQLLEKKIIELTEKNKHAQNARVRLTLYREDGGIFEPIRSQPGFIIESWEITGEMQLNENGLIVDIFPDVRKSCDIFSNIKSNNYLPSVMAGLYAAKNNFDDCMILNSFSRVCETAIANIFIIKNEKIYTPPLSEGCVAGVMRRWLIENLPSNAFPVIEKNLEIDDLLKADEFFLTNAIQQIRWVKTFREKNYSNTTTGQIHTYIATHLS
jgi:branched-chain amino acid aminotransferase